MEIVYSYVGKLPSYIVDTVFQTRCFFQGKISLITNDIHSSYIKQIEPYSVNIIKYEDVISKEFTDSFTRNSQKFCIAPHLGDRKYLFVLSFERFFLLENYMKNNNISNVLFLELDALIYSNPEELLPILSQRDITLSHYTKDSYCSAYFYVKNYTILRDINSHFLDFIEKSVGLGNDSMSEMISFKRWTENPINKEKIWMLPGLWKDENYSQDVWENYEAFGHILFDSVGIAIRVDGPDESHRKEWERRNKMWWGNEVRYYEYDYLWKEENGLRKFYLINEKKEAIHVHFLHVHNKNLRFFLSKPFPIKNQQPNHNYIHGDRFLYLSDIVLRKKSRTDYYKVKDWSESSAFYFENIPEVWNNPNIIFCNTEDVKYLEEHIHKIQNKFILISHNSDENMDHRYDWLVQHPKLFHWFTQNLCEDLPKTSFIPIGIANPIWAHGNTDIFDGILKIDIPKTNLLYTNFRISTNPILRQACHDTLVKKGVIITPIVQQHHNLYLTASSYFTICPEGNGKDTHRFWESLLFKSIPVVIRSYFTEKLFKEGYPCILLNSWEELSPEILKYDPSIFTSELQRKLAFSYFENQIVDKIKEMNTS